MVDAHDRAISLPIFLTTNNFSSSSLLEFTCCTYVIIIEKEKKSSRVGNLGRGFSVIARREIRWRIQWVSYNSPSRVVFYIKKARELMCL